MKIIIFTLVIDIGTTRVGKVPLLCIRYFDTDTLFSVNLLQIPDILRKSNKSVPDTQYTYRGWCIKTPDLSSKKKESLGESYFNYVGVLFFKCGVKGKSIVVLQPITLTRMFDTTQSRGQGHLVD